MDKETDPVKTYELNKLTTKVYWIASIAILIGVATEIDSIRLHDFIGTLLGSLGIIFGITAILTARKSQKRISFRKAEFGLWFSIVTIIVSISAVAWHFFVLIYSSFGQL